MSGNEKGPYKEEAIFLAQNPNWEQDIKTNDHNPNINRSLTKISMLFVLYVTVLFLLFPNLFNGNVSLFVRNIFGLILIFILCIQLYAFVSNKIHENRSQQKYQNHIDEYTDSEVIKAQQEAAKNEWKHICIHCGTKIFAEKEFCPSCGEKLFSNHSSSMSTSEWKTCVCGAKVFANDIFCAACGTKVDPNIFSKNKNEQEPSSLEQEEYRSESSEHPEIAMKESKKSFLLTGTKTSTEDITWERITIRY